MLIEFEKGDPKEVTSRMLDQFSHGPNNRKFILEGNRGHIGIKYERRLLC